MCCEPIFYAQASAAHLYLDMTAESTSIREEVLLADSFILCTWLEGGGVEESVICFA